MKFNVIFILLAAGCIGTVGCAAKAARTAPVAPLAAPQPQLAAKTSVADEPISIAQTNVVLPKPQPIQAEALSTPPPEAPRAPEPLNQTAKPRVPAAPKPEPRQQAGAQAVQGPAPPPPNRASNCVHNSSSPTTTTAPPSPHKSSPTASRSLCRVMATAQSRRSLPPSATRLASPTASNLAAAMVPRSLKWGRRLACHNNPWAKSPLVRPRFGPIRSSSRSSPPSSSIA